MNNDKFTLKVKAYQTTAAFIGFGLAVISAVFTVKLLVSFGNTGFEKVLYGAFGALIQSAQTASYVFACYAMWIQRDKSKAIIGFSLFGLLCALSLCGSIGMFVVSNQRANAEIGSTTDKKAGISDELKAIDAQIAELNQQVRDYTSRGIITKGAKPASERIDKLQDKRSQLSAESRNIAAPKDDPDALYNTIAEFFGCSVSAAKTTLYILYSLALELSSVILLSFSMMMFGKAEPQPMQIAVDPQKSIEPPPRRRDDSVQYEPFKDSPNPVQYEKTTAAIQKNFRLADLHPETPVSLEKQPAGFTPADSVQYKKTPPVEIPESAPNDNHVAELADIPSAVRTPNADHVAAVPDIPPAVKTPNDNHVATVPDFRSRSTPPDLQPAVRTPDPVQYEKKPNPVQYDPEEDAEITPDILKRYIRQAFRTIRPTGYFQTRPQIAEDAGLLKRQGDLCHTWLKDNGLVEVRSMKTFPLMPEQEMIAMIDGCLLKA